MAPKDIKTNLKEAREAIKNKDFATSLKLCKVILKEDRDNYMALVFLGISLQEVGPVDQAPLAFKKAIKLDANNILAWNGLLNYYEKVATDPANSKELVEVYSKLLQVESNEKKICEYCEKLADLSTEDNQEGICKEIYRLTKLPTLDQKCILSCWNSIITVYLRVNKPIAELLPIFEEAFSIIVSDTKTRTRQNYSEYLTLLHKQGKKQEVLLEAEKMNLIYEDDVLPLEWLCKVYNEAVVEGSVFPPDIEGKIVELNEKLLKLQPESAMGLFTKSVLLFNDGQVSDAVSLLQKVISTRPGLLHAWILLTKCYLKLRIAEEAIQAVLRARKLINSAKFSNLLLEKVVEEMYVEALSFSSDQIQLKEVVSVCLRILTVDENNLDILCCLIRAYINSKEFDEAQTYIAKLCSVSETIHLATLYKIKLYHKQNKLEEAKNLLEADDKFESSDWWLEYGDILWELELYEKSLVPYLKAAKLDPCNYQCFACLGRYYEKFGDLDKAKRCYEKAFKLNSKNKEIVLKLSKIYCKLGSWEANVILLESFITENITKENLWVYLQLGLSHLEQGNYEKTIDNLCIVVRLDPTNSHCWESLADAYLARGAYNSSLRCYQKASELEPDSLYSCLQVASVKRALGHYTEARVDFLDVLKKNDLYVPALKGLAETCLNQAVHYQDMQMIGMARDSAQFALNKLTDALRQRSDLSCLWKLCANSCLLIAKLPEKYSCALVATALAEGKPVEGSKALDKHDLYVLAARCYCKALSLIEDNVLLWHDLACCYFAHAQDTLDKQKSTEFFDLALAAAQHCTVVNPEGWQHWNLLGNIYCIREPKNYRLAQHAFIKALEAEKNNAVTWTNLGALYITLGELVLANKAFKEAQLSDLFYVNGWIGQALIAEAVQDKEAMDLFRHSAQLKFHPEGGIGYGNWVCRTLLEMEPHKRIYSIHDMHAIPVACDALTWYTENNPDDACAWNMLGILRERMGLKMGAAQAYKEAFILASPEYRDIGRVNYARALIGLENYSQAIEMYRDVKAATLNSGCGLALALYKDQQYKESYEAYESALHWLGNHDEAFQLYRDIEGGDKEAALNLLHSDLLVALASMAYMFQGPDEAKILLIQSIDLKPPSPWAYYATLSLGLLHDDLKMSKLVLNEMQHLKDNVRCLPHYAWLLVCMDLLQEKYNSALVDISKLIHCRPDLSSLWYTLGVILMLIQEVRQPTQAITKCLRNAAVLGSQTNYMEVSRILCVSALTSWFLDDPKSALISAQKAIIINPATAESWCMLIAYSAMTEKVHEYKRKTQSLIDYCRTKMTPSPGFLHWLKKIELNS